MKKILSISLLTLCALAVAERPAHAWVNSKFSIGLNWHLQSANNNVLWGAWKNGQVPGPEAFGQPGGPLQFGPGPYMPPANGFPWFGNTPGGQAPYNYQQAYYAAPNPYQNPYQQVSYQPGGYYHPSYFYPTYYGYAYDPPYYWYQGR